MSYATHLSALCTYNSLTHIPAMPLQFLNIAMDYDLALILYAVCALVTI
jgi:hypothetical protein